MLTTPVAVGAGTRWTLTPRCPGPWAFLVASCGGGFFHTPAGLLAGAPPGEPVFCVLRQDGRCVGIALGVRHGSRLNGIRHGILWNAKGRGIYFPTVPALTPEVDPGFALSLLEEALRAAQIVEARFDSFDASWHPIHTGGTPGGQQEGLARREYVIPLAKPAAELPARCTSHHRRHIRRGEKDGWTLRLLHGAEADHLLGTALWTAATRAARRGDPFSMARPTIASHADPDLARPWGIVVWSAWHADTPLAAVVVGHANNSAYYITGGSTPEGYARDASIWLQSRVSQALAEADFLRYNLGGTNIRAGDPNHPSHGLHRFKIGFGARIVPCAGLRWMIQTPMVRPAVTGWERRDGHA